MTSKEMEHVLKAMKFQRAADRKRRDANTVRALRLLRDRNPVDEYDVGYNQGIADAIKVIEDDPTMIDRLNDLAQAARERRHP